MVLLRLTLTRLFVLTGSVWAAKCLLAGRIRVHFPDDASDQELGAENIYQNRPEFTLTDSGLPMIWIGD